MNDDNDKPIYNYNTATIKQINFSILSNKEVLKMSALDHSKDGIETSELYEHNEPTENGLLDKKMGITNNSYSCDTCQYRINYCDGHFGHLKLSNELYNIQFFNLIVDILQIFCTHCSSLLSNKKLDDLKNLLDNKKNFEKIKFLKNYLNAKNCYVCNNLVGKVKGEKKNGVIEIIIEKEFDDKTYIEKKTTKEIFNILKNIRENESKLLGLTCHPKDLMYEILIIPPVPVRPSHKGDNLDISNQESTLTMRLVKIVKANKSVIKEKEKEKENESAIKYSKNHIELLQLEVACYINNESIKVPKSMVKNTNPWASLVSKLKGGKKGRIRGNLMGKRVNQYGRTVISPDPLLNLNEAYIPVVIAKKLSYPEIVTPHNIRKLTKLVQNGSDNYPGANTITTFKDGKYKTIMLKNKTLELQFGDVVDRHLLDDDFVALNRQPTLHKYGFLAHKIKVKNDERFNTIRINPSVCKGYGADFDGDEMNIFTAQSILTDIELEHLTNVNKNIISIKDTLPIVGAVFDSVIAPYNITKFVDEMNNELIIDLLTSTNLDNYESFNTNKKYSGKEFFDLIIPKNIYLNNKTLKIKNSKIIDGVIDGNVISAGKENTLIQSVYNLYGNDETQSLIDNITKISINFNLYYGFTISLKDYLVKKELYENMKQLFKTKKLEILYKLTEFENNANNSNVENNEDIIIASLENIRTIVADYIIENMDDENNNKIMLKSKSKGKPDNIAQMIGCVGQQDFDGERMSKSYNNRTLPYFHQNDDSAIARGFIESSLTNGMNLEEFIVQTSTARNAMITQAIKTADTGYLQRRLIKAGEDLIVKYDNYVRNAYDKIFQFAFGDIGTDPTKIYHYSFHLMNKNNQEIEKEYKFTDEQLKNINFSQKENENYFEQIINIRNDLRNIKMKSSLNYYLMDKINDNLKDNIDFVTPVDVENILILIQNETYEGPVVEPNYIINKMNDTLKMNITISSSFDEFNLNNDSFKKRDDEIIKTIFRYILFDCLNLKKCIIKYKFTQHHIDKFFEKIIYQYNNSFVEPGDMVGIMSAQTLGEPATQMTISAFHQSGISGGGTSGVPRLQEIYRPSPNMKSPMMTIYFEDKYKKNEKYLTSVSSNIVNSSIKDVLNNVMICYNEEKNYNDGFMKKDKITENIFSVKNPNKNSCVNNLDELNWIIRMEFNKEKMISNEITLLDIKTQICKEWENRYKDNKGAKKELKKKIFNKILKMAILSNDENENKPIIHLRFNVIDYTIDILRDFIDVFIKEIQIKGMKNIQSIIQNKPIKINCINYENENDYEYVIKTHGINMKEIIKIKGIDIDKLYLNDIKKVEEIYGIEAARTLIINELIDTYKNKGENINYCHYTIFADIMTSLGKSISLDRHGLFKLKSSALAKASFEQPVEILVNAGLYGEVDNMKSVSSRIIGGLCFLGGSNLSEVIIDKDFIENSEYFFNNELQEVQKNINIVSNNFTNEINEDVFIPDF